MSDSPRNFFKKYIYFVNGMEQGPKLGSQQMTYIVVLI